MSDMDRVAMHQRMELFYVGVHVQSMSGHRNTDKIVVALGFGR